MPQDCGAKSRAFLFRSNCITAGTMVGGPGISKSVDRGRWMKGCGQEDCAKLRVLAARSSTAAVWMQQIACQKWHHLWKRAAKCNWMRAGHRQCAWTSLLASFKMPGDRRMWWMRAWAAASPSQRPLPPQGLQLGSPPHHHEATWIRLHLGPWTFYLYIRANGNDAQDKMDKGGPKPITCYVHVMSGQRFLDSSLGPQARLEEELGDGTDDPGPSP